MNCVYFACPRCRSYIDAGYRWAYWTPEEPGIVRKTESVLVDRVLSATEYWSPDDSRESAWLREKVLPKVRPFLLDHQGHGLIYVEEGWVYDREEDGEEWSEVETWQKKAEPGDPPNSRPPLQLPTSSEVQSPDSQRTSSSGGCG
jgi:hypothetical protein